MPPLKSVFMHYIQCMLKIFRKEKAVDANIYGIREILFGKQSRKSNIQVQSMMKDFK